MSDGLSNSLRASDHLRLIEAVSREQAMEIAADIVTAELDLEIAKTGAARLMLSGGGTPRPLYEALSNSDLAWESIICGLVDERWVPEGHAASNASLIRESLLQNKAQDAAFLPMTDGSEFARQGAPAISQLYLAAGQPITVSILGMGPDGHTASWFPNSPDLSAVTSPDAGDWVMAIDAQECPGAGEVRERITLSRPAILGSKTLILLITGEEKRAVLDQAVTLYKQNDDIHTLPVAGLFDAGDRLIVIWAA